MTANAGYHAYATGDVLTAAQVQYNLQNQTVMYFATTTARDAALTGAVLVDGMVSYTPATGIMYYNGSAWTAVGGASPKILQVVSSAYSTETASSSSTYADTGLTATITPTLSTSKILVMLSHTGCFKDSSDTRLLLRLYRASTSIAQIETFAGYTASTSANGFGSMSTQYVDSPATTSATTYKTQFSSTSNAARVLVSAGSSVSTMVLMEVGA